MPLRVIRVYFLRLYIEPFTTVVLYVPRFVLYVLVLTFLLTRLVAITFSHAPLLVRFNISNTTVGFKRKFAANYNDSYHG